MEHQNKSALDGIEVKEHGMEALKPRKGSQPKLGIVGHCPHCGAPIFGRQDLVAGEIPVIQYACSCKDVAK